MDLAIKCSVSSVNGDIMQLPGIHCILQSVKFCQTIKLFSTVQGKWGLCLSALVDPKFPLCFAFLILIDGYLKIT